MVKIVAEGLAFQVDEKLQSITDFFKDLIELQGKKQDVVLTTFKKQDLSRLFQACKIVDYKFKQTIKVNQNDASVYIGAPLNTFFTTLKYSELNSLFKLAKHLRIKLLENNIATFFAAKVYIKLNLEQYNKKKQQLGIKQELTPQKSKELKNRFAFLN